MPPQVDPALEAWVAPATAALDVAATALSDVATHGHVCMSVCEAGVYLLTLWLLPLAAARYHNKQLGRRQHPQQQQAARAGPRCH